MNWELVSTIFITLVMYELIRAVLRTVAVMLLRRLFPSIYEARLANRYLAVPPTV